MPPTEDPKTTPSPLPLEDSELLHQYVESLGVRRQRAQEEAAALVAEAEKGIEQAQMRAMFLIGFARQEQHAKLREVFNPGFLRVEEAVTALGCVSEALWVLQKEVALDALSQEQPSFAEIGGRVHDDYAGRPHLTHILKHVGWANTNEYDVGKASHYMGGVLGMTPRQHTRYRTKVVVLPTDAGREVCKEWGEYCREQSGAQGDESEQTAGE